MLSKLRVKCSLLEDCFSGLEEHSVIGENLRADVLREMSASGWKDVDERETYESMQDPYK